VKSALVPDQDRMVAVPAQPTAGTEWPGSR
jgi:hypothetical protein